MGCKNRCIIFLSMLMVLWLTSCVDEYLFWFGGLRIHDYVCANGTADDYRDEKENVVRCVSCDEGYELTSESSCELLREYICTNGAPSTDGKTVVPNSEKCISCNSGYQLVAEKCTASIGYTEQPKVTGTATAVNTTVTLTTDADATLYWILYSDETAVTDPNNVVDNAGNTTEGVARSGADGVDITGGEAYLVILSELDPDNEYDFYAVIEHTDDTAVRMLSNKLDIRTETTTQGFTSQPSFIGAEQTIATISLAAHESASLSWVVYDSEQTTLDAETLVDNSSDNSKGVARSSSEGIGAASAKSIDIDNLEPLTQYYFYAVLQHTDGSKVLSSVLPFKTTGYSYVCGNGTPADEETANQNITNCVACDAGYEQSAMEGTTREDCAKLGTPDSWTVQTSNAGNTLLTDVDYLNSTWVVVGNDIDGNGGILYSSDAQSWNKTSIGVSTKLYEIAYVDNTWLVQGWVNRVHHTTADLTAGSWATSYTHSATSDNYGILDFYSNSDGTHIVSITDNNKISTRSSVGGTGTYRPSGLAGQRALTDIHFADTTYTIVGEQGTIIIGGNAINWWEQTSGTENDLQEVDFAEIWVAVGDSGTILTSPHAETWTTQNSGTQHSLNGLYYGNGMWVAVGDSGTILTSPDAMTWTARRSDTDNNLTQVVYKNSTWVAVGENGTIVTFALTP